MRSHPLIVLVLWCLSDYILTTNDTNINNTRVDHINNINDTTTEPTLHLDINNPQMDVNHKNNTNDTTPEPTFQLDSMYRNRNALYPILLTGFVLILALIMIIVWYIISIYTYKSIMILNEPVQKTF